jgi:pimeloyl-ACP methyl ester carboxylesterase
MCAEVEKARPLFKVLMLHGYKQTQTLFYDRTGGLRKFLKNYAKLIYVEAPHIIPIEEELNKTSESLNDQVSTQCVEKQRAWYLKSNEWPNRDRAKDLEQTLVYLNSMFEKEGPIDAVCGFSQGATIACILASIATNDQLAEHERFKYIRFRFAIIAATNKGPEIEHQTFYSLEKKINMPTLHMIGSSDKIILLNSSLELTNYFVDPKVFIHDCGHCIPVNAETKVELASFFNCMYDKFST